MNRILLILLMFFSWQSVAIEDRFLQALHEYENGRTVSAYKKFTDLANNDNNPNAMAILVKMYGEGIGTNVDSFKSVQILQKALFNMDKFNPEYAYQMGMMYKRLGDNKTSMQAFKDAANFRHADAAYEIALARRELLNGLIVDMSKWALIASKLGSEKANDEKQLFKSYMPNRSFVNQGKIKARNWLRERDENYAEKFSEDAKKIAKSVDIANTFLEGFIDSIQIDENKLLDNLNKLEQNSVDE